MGSGLIARCGIASVGTPWFTLIDAQGHIVFEDFCLDVERLLAASLTADGDLREWLVSDAIQNQRAITA